MWIKPCSLSLTVFGSAIANHSGNVSTHDAAHDDAAADDDDAAADDAGRMLVPPSGHASANDAARDDARRGSCTNQAEDEDHNWQYSIEQNAQQAQVGLH